jgi:hypothetical protein
MTIMIAEVYDAFIEAKVSDPTARKAAEAIAAYDSALSEIKSDLRMLKWAQAATFTMTLAVLVKLFIH